jgi:hypothetical protein
VESSGAGAFPGGTDTALPWRSGPLLAAVAAMVAIWLTLHFLPLPLIDRFAFRQTQTALTSFWTLREGWQFDYQTPVAGYPWNGVMLEVPIYQWLVALVAWLGGLPLDATGRAVSFSFLLACLWPAAQLRRRIDLPRDAFWVFAALLLTSPLYLLVGRAFLIETAALFFTFAALPHALDLARRPAAWRAALWLALFGSLGMLQKVTTALSVLLVAGLCVLLSWMRRQGLRRLGWPAAGTLSLAFAPPVLLFLAWNHHADGLRQANLIGRAITPANNLGRWFGSLEQRLDLGTLKVLLWDRLMVPNAAGVLGLGLLIAAAVAARRARGPLLLALLLCAAPILTHIHVHERHAYYSAAALLYLLAAVAIAVTAGPWSRWARGLVGLGLAGALVVSNLLAYARIESLPPGPLPDPAASTSWAVGRILEHQSDPGSAIVVFAGSWSSEIGYFAERKALAVPDWLRDYEAIWADPARFLGATELGALVFCAWGTRALGLADALTQPDVRRWPRLYRLRDCLIWLPGAAPDVIGSAAAVAVPSSFMAGATGFVAAEDMTCDGAIERLQVEVATRQTAEPPPRVLSLEGWLLLQRAPPEPPERVFGLLRDGDAPPRFFGTARLDWPDVAGDGEATPPPAGFAAEVLLPAGEGPWQLDIAVGHAGQLRVCRNLGATVPDRAAPD